MTNDKSLVIVRQHHWRRYVGAAIILFFLAFLVKAFADGDIAWSVAGQYLFAPTILRGVANTIVMTICATALSIALGVLFATMYISPNPVLRASAVFYIWFFRGTPILLQLLIWFNLALVFPHIGIPGIWEARTVEVITPFVATLLGLGINQGSYTAEIVRAGIQSVDSGQTEAAKAIGMTRIVALRRIVLPQAMRVIIPPLGNETISMAKLTSIASVIEFAEVVRNAQTIYFSNGRIIELLFVAAAWYLVLVTMLSIGQYALEQKFRKGVVRQAIKVA